MRVVLDTGVYVSALITQGTPPDTLYQSWINKQFTLITSVEQIREISRVMGYKKLQKFLNADEAAAMIEAISLYAEVLIDLPDVHLSPDPDDDIILATAIAGKADYLVSGDKKDLLALKQVNGVAIVTARQAVEILEQAA